MPICRFHFVGRRNRWMWTVGTRIRVTLYDYTSLSTSQQGQGI